MCYRVRGIYHFNPLDAKVIGRLCQDHKITIMMATPTFLKMYLRRCDKEQFKTLDLIVVGAEKLPVDLAKQFEEKFGILPTELDALLSANFELIEDAAVDDSIPVFSGRERWQVWRRR